MYKPFPSVPTTCIPQYVAVPTSRSSLHPRRPIPTTWILVTKGKLLSIPEPISFASHNQWMTLNYTDSKRTPPKAKDVRSSKRQTPMAIPHAGKCDDNEKNLLRGRSMSIDLPRPQAMPILPMQLDADAIMNIYPRTAVTILLVLQQRTDYMATHTRRSTIRRVPS